MESTLFSGTLLAIPGIIALWYISRKWPGITLCCGIVATLLGVIATGGGMGMADKNIIASLGISVLLVLGQVACILAIARLIIRAFAKLFAKQKAE